MRKAFQPKEKYPTQPHVPPMPSIAQLERCKNLLPCSICDRTGEPCRKYVDQRDLNEIKGLWYALWREAAEAMEYVDCDNDCDEKYLKRLDELDDRFCKAIAHLEE